MKRYLSLALALLLVLAAVPAMAEESAYDKTVSFSMNVIYTDRVQADARTKYVLDKFNVDIEFIACSSSDYIEKSRMWIAGDDMPDVMWTAFNFNSQDLLDFVESEMLRPWPDLENYPNIKAIQDSIGPAVEKNIEMCGDRYFLFTEGGYMNCNQIRSQGFYYRKDWAQNLGLYHEDDVYTWDELVNMAIAFGTQDPDGNGLNDTIGMTSIGNSYPGGLGLNQNALNWSAFALVDGEYHWRCGDPDVVEAIKELKYLYDSGALWEEQILAQENDGVNKMASGLAGICFNNWHMGQVTTLLQGLRDVYPDKDVKDIVAPMLLYNKDGSVLGNLSDGYWGSICLSAKISDEALERFMDMYEWLASDEGFYLGAVGIEGKDYQIEADGTVTMLWDKDPETGAYVTPYQPNAHRFVTMNRLSEGWDLNNPAADADARILGNKLNDWIQNAEVQKLIKTDWDLAVLTKETAPLYKNLVLSPNATEKVKELIISSTADTIESDWLAWVESVQGQIKPVEEELNRVVLGK